MLTTKVMSGSENENPGPTNHDVKLNIIAFNTKLKHPNVTIVDETDITVLDVVNNDKLLFTKAALSKVEEGLQ